MNTQWYRQSNVLHVDSNMNQNIK